MPKKELLTKYTAQFLALPQWQQGLAGAAVVGIVLLLWPSAHKNESAPIVVVPVVAQSKEVSIAQTPAIKIAEKSQIPIGTTAITKLKLVKALPVGIVTSANLKSQLEADYQARLSFPLTEDKMVRFAEAALQVENTNRRWDVQIAAADNDAMAIEYLKMSRAESVKAVQTVQGITMPEYTEIFNLTAQDDRFNQIAIAYKDLVAVEQKKQAKLQQEATQVTEQVTDKPEGEKPTQALPSVQSTTPVVPLTAPPSSPPNP